MGKLSIGNMTVEEYLSYLPYETRNEFPRFLIYCNRFNNAEQFLNDPFWGDLAQEELDSHRRSQDFKVNEMMRIAQSHPHVQEIDEIIRKAGPSNYHVHYPYPPYGEGTADRDPPAGMKPFHNVPNCLNIGADGGPVFRLEVLDTEGLTRYRLADLKKPWWRGEYDFDFPAYGISEGEEFDHTRLLEILRKSVEKINNRHRS